VEPFGGTSLLLGDDRSDRVVSRGPGVQTCTNVRAGDWIVGGLTRNDRDVGKVCALLHDDVWEVAWTQGIRTPCDVSAEDVEVFDRQEDAEARRAALDV